MTKQFWVKTVSGSQGPFTSLKLRKLAASGKLLPNHNVSTNQEKWVLASSVRGLEFASPTESIVEAEIIQPDNALDPFQGLDDLGGIADFLDENLEDTSARKPPTPKPYAATSPATTLAKTGPFNEIYVTPGDFDADSFSYEFGTDSSGAPSITITPLRGGQQVRPIRYNEANADPGDTDQSYAIRMLVVVMIFVLGFGIVGMIIIFLLGLDTHRRQPWVGFFRSSNGVTDPDTEFAVLNFSSQGSFDTFVTKLRATVGNSLPIHEWKGLL